MPNSDVIKFRATFDNRATKKDGTHVLKFKSPYSDIHHAIGILRAIDVDSDLTIVLSRSNIKKAGVVRFAGMRIDKEGESTVQFESDLKALKLTDADIQLMIDTTVRVAIRIRD